MTTDRWHASDEMLRSYARGEGAVSTTASIEAHLMRCAHCRDRIAAEVCDPLLGVAWARVADGVQASPEPVVVRVLRRLGLSETDAVLLSAARSVRGAWTLATIAVVVFATLAAIPGVTQGQALYLLVAPLVPVIGVVAAFGSADPLAVLTCTTPYLKARLALLRAAAVLITSAPLSVAVGLVVPGTALLAFAWLLPAIALTLLTLVAMTWFEPEPAGVALGAVWFAVIAAAYATDDVVAAVGAQLQLLYLVVALCAAAGLALRIRGAHTPGGYA